MSFELPIMSFSRTAYADLSATGNLGSGTTSDGSCQFLCVYERNNGTVNLQTTPGGTILGVLQNKPSTGQSCTIWSLGVSKCYCDNTVTDGNAVQVGASGGVKNYSSGYSIGTALESGVAGDIVAVMINPQHGTGASTTRAGMLYFDIPVKLFHATGTVYAALPLGFAGTIVDMFAVASSTGTATASATAALSLTVTSTAVTGLSIPVGQLTAANVTTPGTVMTSTGKTGIGGTGVFTSSDTLTINVTQGSTVFGSSDTAHISLYIITN